MSPAAVKLPAFEKAAIKEAIPAISPSVQTPAGSFSERLMSRPKLKRGAVEGTRVMMSIFRQRCCCTQASAAASSWKQEYRKEKQKTKTAVQRKEEKVERRACVNDATYGCVHQGRTVDAGHDEITHQQSRGQREKKKYKKNLIVSQRG